MLQYEPIIKGSCHMHIASLLVLLTFGLFGATPSNAPITDKLTAHTTHRVKAHGSTSPQGLTLSQIRAAYHLPVGGSGTIAIIDAYDYPNAASDLNTFSKQVVGNPSGFPVCSYTAQTACFEKVLITKRTRSDSGWALESALDTQWAHAVAPSARILLVEARSSSLTDLLAAVDFARKRSDVVAVSMSWGANEFSSETSYDQHFVSANGHPMAFFASSGDSGHGVSWPAASNQVTSVGGTLLTTNGASFTETAWSGSGGGTSLYESKPNYQSSLGGTKRSVPDVSYNADPNSGVPVYLSGQGSTGWYTVGGTSAGAPQWAAIHSLGQSAYTNALYSHIGSSDYFRDITTGSNGTCGTDCTTTLGYDKVTGLGSPLTVAF